MEEEEPDSETLRLQEAKTKKRKQEMDRSRWSVVQ
jgi:hypothetical protein